MASFDLNKPATSTWTPPNVARSNADKNPGRPPSRLKMASESEGKSAASGNWNASVASNMDLPMWPNNVAMDLLLMSMYGVNNLSILANAGSISPFGLFPLGLPVPPIPMMPQSTDASRIPPTGRVVPKTVQRHTSSAIHLAKSGNLNRALNGTVSAIDMTLSRDNKQVKLGDRVVPRSFLSKPSTLESGGGSSSQHFTNTTGYTTSRDKAMVLPRTANIISSPVAQSAVRSMNKIPSKRTAAVSKKEASNWKLPATKMPLVSVKATSSGIHNIKSRETTETTTTSNQPHAGRNPARIVGTYAAKTVSLPFDSHFRDAEAAAILLGLRHGLNEPCRTSAHTGGSTSVWGSMQAARVRENSNQIHGNRTQDEGFDFSQTAPTQAVDLSTKRKLKSQEAPRRGNINSKYNSIKPVHERTVERLKQQHTKTVLPAASKDVETRNASAKAGNILAQSAPIKHGPKRQFLPPTSGDSTTSVVSHLPSCICAFDCSSHVEGCNRICAEQGRILQGQQLPIAGFNFKKAICEKFSQASPACNSNERSTNLPCVQHTYAVAESTSRAPLQPTWSISAPTNTSAAQSSVKSKEHVNTNKRQSLKYVATTGSIAETLPLSTNGSQAMSVIGNAARVINTLPSSGVHATSIRLSKTISKPPPVQTHKLNDTSSQRLAVTVAGTSDITTASAVSQKSDFRQTIHSFSALRQKSVEFYNTFDRGDDPRGITGKSMMAGTSTTTVGETFKPRLPVSNLYRVRNSGIGGSNDSLHSDHPDAAPKKQDSGDDSDSSESGSDSESSGGANSDESDDESDREVSAAKNEPIEQPTVKNGVKQASASASRLRFVLNRPKFTHGSTEAANAHTTKKPDGCSSKPGSPTPSPSSKVTIRRPTFTFSSSGSIASAEETKDTKQGDTSTKYPELKCDDDEGQNSFKFKFIQALSKPDSKEGLAVDGKSLRALLGEADYFYHNNKKYVLKRYMTTAKPKEDFIANVAGSNGVVPANKSARRDALNNNVLERGNYPRIEPRISVTARKRTELTDMMEIKTKKAKKLRKREFPTHEKKQAFDGGGKRVKLETKSAAKHSIPRNKRRRRIHEIDNLVFEGAGGLTPIPDLTLRDSDVFSNIKLRRREAAKRGIAESTTETEKCVSKKSSLRTKWLKTAAHKRAIANKNRKRSIEEKLRRYRKKKRLFVIKNVNQTPDTPPLHRSSCVRINAGIARPHLAGEIVAASEAEKLRKNPITGRNENRQDGDCICSVTPESKQSLHAKSKVTTFKCHTADGGKKLAENSLKRKQYLNRENCELKPKSIDLTEKRQAAGEVEKQSIGPSDIINEGGRRISKRISERNISVDSVSNVKKCDDETAICDSDSVRSDSPVLTTTRSKNQRKRRVYAKGRASPCSTKLSSSKSTRNGRGFTLVSCFTTPSAITLAAAFGDLQPSYSAKVPGKLGSPNAWEVGPSALEVKQQLQREMWRNMTLDMFTNSANKLSMDNGR